jgi:hypothetical protein
MTLPSENLIALADQLAELLCCEKGLATFQAATQLHKLSSKPNKGAGRNTDSDMQGRVRVGIWQRESHDSAAPFVRDVTGDSWRLWADVAEIPAKSSKQRVVLLGESVARGFFYDPHINPAMVLQSMLNRATEAESFEVIDLARIDLSLAPLLELARSALELEPDAIVVFAGNNWHPISTLKADQLREIALLVRNRGSWVAVKSYLEQLLRHQVERFLADLGAITRQRGIPVVFLIPEFNLMDWVSDATAPPLLNDAKLHQWFRTRKQAEQAVEEQKFDEGARLARILVELDGATTPVGFNIESKCRPDPVELRRLKENARDAVIALTKHQSPRCFGVVQKVLREKAAAHGISIVDVPREFENHLGGLPDRRLFHDYCHLTLEGMNVAMSVTGEHLLTLLSRPHKSQQSILEDHYPVSSRVVSEASFLAALHNANLGNRRALIRYHLDKAIEFDQDIVKMMWLYMDFQLRSTPSPLCGSFEEMARTASPSVLSMLLRSSRHEKATEFRLLEELVRGISGVQPEASKYAQAMLAAEHKVSQQRLDLLQPPYIGPPAELSWDQKRYGYYRSCTRESKFIFICNGAPGIELQITSRTHGSPGGREIVIKINGHPVHEFKGRSTWLTVVFTLPEKYLQQGTNELEIVWPEDGWASAERIPRTLASLEEGRIAEAGPIFGEVSMLMISSMCDPEPTPTDQSFVSADIV